LKTVQRIAALLLAALVLRTPAGWAAESMVVAVNKDDPLFGYTDENGHLSGFSVDLARALCAAMRVDCTLTPIPFAELIPGVVEGRFDFVVATVLRTPDREALVDFSDRIWRSSSTFVARTGTMAEVSAETLKGKTVAVQSGSIQERFIREVHGGVATILAFPSNIERNAALAAGKAELMLSSVTSSFTFLKSPDGADFEIIGGPLYDRGLGGDVAIPVAKGRDALRRRINAAIDAVLRDGTYSLINSRYLPMSVY